MITIAVPYSLSIIRTKSIILKLNGLTEFDFEWPANDEINLWWNIGVILGSLLCRYTITYLLLSSGLLAKQWYFIAYLNQI